MKSNPLFVAVLLPLFAHAQDPCTAIQEAKEKTYGFRPAELDEKGQSAKSAEMDKFWELVKKQGGASCLLDLLTNEMKDGFFLFDGATLLLDIDASAKNIAVVLGSLLRADLDQVDPAGYVRVLLRLAKLNADVGPLGRRYLEQVNAESYLPMHSMKMDRLMGALLVFGSMPGELSDRYLADALKSSRPEARTVSAQLLAYNLTEDGFRTLAFFQGLAELPERSRSEIAAMRKHTPYESPKAPPKFSRAQVLEYIRLIPHSREDYEKAVDRRAKYEKKHREPKPPGALGDEKWIEAMNRQLEESPPFTALAGHRRFIESAIANLTEADLPAVHDARRKAIHGLSDETMYEYFAYTKILLGVINRLDLYKEYRQH